jgi:putative ABC transport system substrate-binding protein
METATRDIEAAARAMALQIKIVNASTSDEIHAAFERLLREPADALFVSSDPFFLTRRVQLATFAARLGFPTSFAARDLVKAGGLMSYGTDISVACRQTGVYAGRILLGAKPDELPVMQSTKFELVINLATARILGLTVPQSLLATAEDVIE